jgi:SAM-dependent methyltransferase
MTDRFSFEVVDAADYDELRPGYAREAVAWVVQEAGLGLGSTVVDLAAGTGQLSRHLAAMGIEVVAVEPAANMRAILSARLPTVRTIDAVAERLPFADAAIDAVVVGNAFHHFDRDAAFAEIHRVLRPGGSLALFWAWPLEEEQLEIPGMRELYDAADRALDACAITEAYRSWANPPAAPDGFDAFERREFRLTHVLPSSRLADLWATSSDVASLPLPARTELLERVRRLARGLPGTLRLPARTVVDISHRTRETVQG